MTEKIDNLKQLKTFLKTNVLPLLKQKTIVFLSGELGAGKTQTAKYLVDLLGGNGAASPTFSIINEYKTKHGNVYHMDLYRIESEADLESTGFWDLFRDETVIMIEWPEKIPGLQFPSDWHHLRIQITLDNESRVLALV